MSACLFSPRVYTPLRGVENLKGGHRTRKPCGIFFACSHASACLINGQEGKEIPNTLRRTFAVSNLLTTPWGVVAFDFENQRSAIYGQ